MEQVLVLSKEEKDKLYSKIEHSRKKRLEEKGGAVKDLLQGEKEEFNKEDILLILKSLEYSFKTKSSSELVLKLKNFVPEWSVKSKSK